MILPFTFILVPSLVMESNFGLTAGLTCPYTILLATLAAFGSGTVALKASLDAMHKSWLRLSTELLQEAYDASWSERNASYEQCMEELLEKPHGMVHAETIQNETRDPDHSSASKHDDDPVLM